MSTTDLYQRTRTTVKRQLNRLVELVGMEYAIRASTTASVDEAEAGLRAALAERGFDVVHETDVQALHGHYNLEYPEYRILKVASGPTLADCGMATDALAIDKGMSVFLPPSVVIYDLGGETRVSAIRPSTLLALFTDDDLRTTIRELEGALWAAIEAGVPDVEMLSEEPPVPPGQEDRHAGVKQGLNLLLTLVDAEYSIHVSTEAPRSEVEASLRDALTRRGQHVLGTVDARDTRILLVINPGQAHKLLALEPDVGVFAPLSVGIYEDRGRTHVRCVRPSTLLIFFTDPDLQAVLLEMEELLWNALTEGVPGATLHSRQPPLPPGTGQRTTAAGTAGGLGAAKKPRPE